MRVPMHAILSDDACFSMKFDERRKSIGHVTVFVHFLVQKVPCTTMSYRTGPTRNLPRLQGASWVRCPLRMSAWEAAWVGPRPSIDHHPPTIHMPLAARSSYCSVPNVSVPVCLLSPSRRRSASRRELRAHRLFIYRLPISAALLSLLSPASSRGRRRRRRAARAPPGSPPDRAACISPTWSAASRGPGRVR